MYFSYSAVLAYFLKEKVMKICDQNFLPAGPRFLFFALTTELKFNGHRKKFENYSTVVLFLPISVFKRSP